MTFTNRARLRASLLSAACMAVLLSGCGTLGNTIKDAAMVDSVTRDSSYYELQGVTGSTDQYVPLAFNLDCDTFAKPGAVRPRPPREGEAECGKETEAAYALATNLSTEESKRAELRNRLMWVLLARSDAICQVHKAAIHGDAAVFSTVASQIASTLSTLGAVVTGATTTRVLSGAAAYMESTDNNVRARIFQEKLPGAITDAIDAKRVALRDDMLTHETEPVSTYSVDRMIYDVGQYHQACSFFEGLTALTKNAKDAGEEAAEESTTGASPTAKPASNAPGQRRERRARHHGGNSGGGR